MLRSLREWCEDHGNWRIHISTKWGQLPLASGLLWPPVNAKPRDFSREAENLNFYLKVLKCLILVSDSNFLKHFASWTKYTKFYVTFDFIHAFILWANKGPEKENDLPGIVQQIPGKDEPRTRAFLLQIVCCVQNDMWTTFIPTSSHACTFLLPRKWETWFLLVPPMFLQVLSGDLPFMESGDEIKMRHWQGKPIKAFFPTSLSWQSDQESLAIFSEDRWLVFSCCPLGWMSTIFLLSLLVIETILQPF